MLHKDPNDVKFSLKTALTKTFKKGKNQDEDQLATYDEHGQQVAQDGLGESPIEPIAEEEEHKEEERPEGEDSMARESKSLEPGAHKSSKEQGSLERTKPTILQFEEVSAAVVNELS